MTADTAKPLDTAQTLGEMVAVALVAGSTFVAVLREAELALANGDYDRLAVILNNSAVSQATAYDSIQALLYRALPRSGAVSYVDRTPVDDHVASDERRPDAVAITLARLRLHLAAIADPTSLTPREVAAVERAEQVLGDWLAPSA